MAEEIRPLHEDELDENFNLTSQAFRNSPADVRRWRKHARLEEFRGVFVDGQMQAVLELIEMPIWFGAAPVTAGGISGVASPPENRRRGYIGRLLHATLTETRDKGWPLSTLYPFHFPFYKRYGWEHISDNFFYKVPMGQLPMGQVEGSWRPLVRGTDLNAEEENTRMSDADLAILRGIYDTWVVGRSGAIARDERWWRMKLREGMDKRPDVYYWRDPAGRPRAYIMYTFETLENQWTRRLHVRDVVALDMAALRAVLTFLRHHDSQAKEIRLRLPEDLRFLALLDDPEFTVEVEAGVMLRVVDVVAALAARRYPAGVGGQVTLQVSDSFLDWNNGAYRLEVGDGAGQAARTDAAPDLSMDQKTLSRLYSGYLTAREAATLGLLEVHEGRALALAEQLFALPRPFMADYF
jgi:predicted acetyltransferase